MEPHQLRLLIEEAARGRFPAPNGSVRVLRSPGGAAGAVIGFTAHHLVAADVDPDEVRHRLPPGDLGAPLHVRFLVWLGNRIDAAPGSLDVILAAPGLPDGPEPPLLGETTGVTHDRVARADQYRSDVRTFRTRDGSGVLVLGRGLAGRMEVALELDADARSRGLGRRMILAARALVAADEMLFAQVAPGNAASLRAFLAAGFVPIGAEVLFLRTAS